MAFPFPPGPDQPIPNNPFYAPEENYITGEYGPFIIGAGLVLDQITGVLSATGTGGVAVTSIIPGAGISVNQSTGAVTVSNTGVLNVTAGNGIQVVNAGGNFIVTNTAPASPTPGGTVTQVNTGAGLVGGPITGTGTISLAPTPIAPGTYTNPTVSVDAYGRITFITNGSGGGASGILATAPLQVTSTFPQSLSIAAASTSSCGAVQLNNTVTSTSTTQAATAGAVKQAYDLAAGASSGVSGAVTTANNAFTKAVTACNTALSAQSTANAAQITATAAQVDADQALINAANALTAANLRIPCGAFVSKGNILAGTGPSNFTALPLGASGQILSVDASTTSGLKWIPAPATGVSSINAGIGLSGGLITTSGTISLANTSVVPGSYLNANITIDAQGRITSASDGTSAGGTVTVITTSGGISGGPITTSGNICIANTAVIPGSYTNANITVNSKGQITAAANGTPASGVTSITAGTGLSGGTITSTGTIALANTTVTAGSYTYGSFTVDNQGRLTAASSGVSPVTAITAGTGLSGGTITSTGTINLANTAVSPGSYNYASLTVDAQGRLTAASSGTPPVTSLTVTNPITNSGTALLPNIGVNSASTTSQGVVQLNDTVNNSSILQAATARALCETYLVACNAIPRSVFTSKGDLIAGTAPNTGMAISVGTTGQVLSADPSTLSGLRWVDACQGGVTSVTGTLPIQVATGATTPVVSIQASSTTACGAVQLATLAEVVAGTNSTKAVTPDTLSATYMPLTGGTFTGPVTFNSSLTAAGTTCISGALTTTNTVTNCGAVGNCGSVITAGTTTNIGAVTNCALVTNCSNVITCGTTTNVGAVTNCALVTNCGNVITCGTTTNVGAVTNCDSVTTCGTTTNVGVVTNCALVTNCNNVVTCGTTTNVGAVTNCDLVINCDDVITCGATTNVGNVTNCGTTTLCGATTFCNTATFTCPATFCQPVTFCSTPILPVNTPLGCAACITYSNTTSGLTATNVQAAIDEVNAKTALPATTTTLGNVCIGANISVTPAGQISVSSSSTSQTGVVQLYNDVDSTSVTCALTAAQGKLLQDQITALSVSGGVVLAGTLDASTGNMVSVTSQGSGAGFASGSPLPAASSSTNNYYAIVTVAGTVTPPGGSATAATQGDWFLVSETSPSVYAWTFLNVGFDAPVATTTNTGLVQLATNAQAQVGTNTANAVTPSALQSKVSDSIATTSSTTIASSTAVKCAYDLANDAIPKACVTGKGALVTGTAAGAPVALAVGSDCCVLIACAACPSGLTWGTLPLTMATSVTCGVVYACTLGGANQSTSLGYCALPNVTVSGTQNVAIGQRAAQALTNGQQNVAIGTQALACSTCPLYNIAMGSSTLRCADAPLSNVAIGNGALFYGGVGANALCQNTVVGHQAGSSLGCVGSAIGNVVMGIGAASFMTSGCNNVILGSSGASLQTSGSNNVVIGPSTNVVNITGSCQLAIGFANGSNWLTGDSTKAIKPGAGIIDCAGSCGTANQVLVSTGSNAIRWSSTGLLCGFTNVATPFNTALGYCAGANATGLSNTLIGMNAGCTLTTGGCNILIGDATGSFGNNNTCCNVVIAPRLFNTYNLAGTSNNNVAISSGGTALYSLGAPSNSIIQIGNSNHIAAYINIGWTITSDIRDKTDLDSVALGLNFVREITPIQYRRCDRDTHELNSDKLYYGFSAQEVREKELEHAGKAVIVDDSREERLFMTADHLNPVLVNAIKQLADELDKVKAELAELKTNG